MVKSTMFKEKPKEAEKEFLKIRRTETYFHPVEAFSAMSEGMKKQAEGFSAFVSNPFPPKGIFDFLLERKIHSHLITFRRHDLTEI